MYLEITKQCADSLRSFILKKFGIQLKSSHAHEIVAAYFGYSSRAALLADKICPIDNLRQAEFIVLTSTAKIKERRTQLNGLPPTLPEDIAEGVYLPLLDNKWILHSIWPTLEDLGIALVEQNLKSKPAYFRDMKIQRHGVKLEFHNDEVAIAIFREYVSSSPLSLSPKGKRGVVDIFNLKRVAGFIGYVKTNHYSTEADTLDTAVEQMKDVYHQIISPAQPHQDVKPLLKPEPNFADWIAKQKNRNSPLGDLANQRGFTVKSKVWPAFDNLKDYQNYLTDSNPPLGAMAALQRAWKSYQIYLHKRQSSGSVKQVKRSTQNMHDSRKIVYVKNAKPIHYSKRIIENFVSGNKAWVSWEGRKAIPVTVLKVDDRYYTFRVERPLKETGNEHYVRLDEVYSTPELACMNHVTS